MATPVWYLEGRRVSGGAIERDAQAMGSAVMVKLERLRLDDGAGTTRWIPHDPPEIGRYLLTCAHVVVDPNGGHFGEIIAWQPGAKLQHWPSDAAPRRSRMGVGDIGGHLVQLAIGPTMAPDGVLAAPARAYNDWVLLAFGAEPPGVVAHGSAVERWADFDADGVDVTIAGYPGGATGWAKGHTIEPTLVSGFHVKRRDDGQGHVVLAGADETRAGMSGGGVFLPDGALAGLHRAAFDAGMERYSVAGQDILAWLAERGMRPPPARATSSAWPLRGVGAGVLLGAIGAAVVTWRPNPPVAKVCIQVHVGERAVGSDGRSLVQLPMEGLRLTLRGDWMAAPVQAGPTDVNGRACFAPVTLKRDDGAKTFPFRIHSENVPDVLSPYAPLMVVPHGVEADGRRRGTDPDLAQFVNATTPIPLMVMGQATVHASRLSGAVQGPEATDGKQNLLEQIVNAARRESIAPAERDKAVQAWATILQQSRPVIAAADWSSKHPDKHARVVAAVGMYFEDGVRKATGFVIDRNSVVLPAFSVSQVATRRWITFGERPGANTMDGRVELGAVRLGTIATDTGY